MPDEFQIYQSDLTGPELDEALRNIGKVQQSVADAAQSAATAGENAADAAQAAQTAETYGAIVQQNQQAIQDIADNLDAVQGAAQNAQAAQSAAAAADASAQEAEQWAEQAQQIAQGAMGWYADPQALQSAHPTGQNGQWAIVGTTDTIWIWDSDTSAWVDSGTNMDLSQYYTKAEADDRFATVQQVQQAQSAASSAQEAAGAAQSAADAATSKVYTAVFPASGWVEMDGGGYEQTAACAGMTADITPQPPTVQTTGSAEADKAALAALACIQAVQTLAGQVRALCYDAKPAADVTLCLTEVR